MKHNAQMYTFLKQREKLFDGLMACLKDEDPNVRKVREAQGHMVKIKHLEKEQFSRSVNL